MEDNKSTKGYCMEVKFSNLEKKKQSMVARSSANPHRELKPKEHVS